MKKSYAIVGLQYGSEAKGAIAGYLARRFKPDAVACAFGPNAGHTFIPTGGSPIVTRQLPIASYTSPNIQRTFVGPGAVIDARIWSQEIDRVSGRVLIHPHASVLDTSQVAEEEEHLLKIGSTMKGTGASIAAKVMRRGTVAREDGYLRQWVVDESTWLSEINKSTLMQIEAAQGFSLSVHHGFYPYTTSRDCTVASLVSDCGLPLRIDGVVGCMRTYPIRVANRFNSEGEQVGHSGPCYDDQTEIQWADIDQEPQLTTVTQLPRRLFTLSLKQIAHAVYVNGVHEVFLSHMDFLHRDQWAEWLHMLHTTVLDDAGAKVRWFSAGPREDDVTEVNHD